MQVIMSIKPEYVAKILSGEKKYEFRRQVFKRKDVDTVLIYCTAPVSRVVAKAHIVGVCNGTVDSIWDTCGDHGGIDQYDFYEYFKGKKNAYAVEMSDVEQLMPLPITSYGLKYPPQSFAYQVEA